ncbi:MAG: histidine kinase [Candidatus Pseudobacter hemicellulosilyticus]|uniref:Histidine kinase n=1 Tax=Candidatus Pseudobacter hemicellulosilyticus TaxID=3121375 RepID=A0AAJ5WNG8_9BACT|nr:MAG: histidine kinase [Pseudobacter sp.]
MLLVRPIVLIRNPLVSFLLHFLVWEGLYMLMGLPSALASQFTSWSHFFFTYGLLGSINFLLFYLSAFLIFPVFFIHRRRILWMVVISVLMAIFFTYGKYLLEFWHHAARIRQWQADPSIRSIRSMPLGPIAAPDYMRNFVWFNFLIIIIGFAYQLLLLWFGQEKIHKELENQKLEAELSFLRMQINPHFLFNALNNIYSLAVIEKSTKTSDGIMKLSEMIRYMLYEKEDAQNRVLLDKEIDHINNYIELQKMRHDGSIYIHFSIEGETITKRIPPLLLFPLIENAIKHGILQDPQCAVSIYLKVTDDELNFSVYNCKNSFLKDQAGGIGLVNVRKRLALLYPKSNKVKLDIQETGDAFTVHLHLPL